MQQLSVKLRPETPGTGVRSERTAYLLAFYLGIPVALALYSGASESGSAAFVEKRYYFYYFLAASLPVWLAFDVCTRCLQWILKPWQPRLLVILVLGAVLGLHLQGLWTPWRQSLFEPYLAEGSSFYPVFPWRYDEADYLIKAVIALTAASAVWTGANFFFLRVLGIPRYGYHAEGRANNGSQAGSRTPQQELREAEAGIAPPARRDVLLDKLPPSLGRDVVALKAEEHYTRVYTTEGETLILMRFSDAMDLLQELKGLQIHRSYWVNPRHIVELVRDGRSSHITLKGGIELPVSRTYRVKVMEALAARDGLPLHAD